MTGESEISQLEKQLTDLKQAIRVLADPDFIYRLRKYAAAYEAILTRYARFKVGDCIQLARTPVITEQNAPGWMSSKHFLVKGARGTVTTSDILPGNGKLRYGIIFDDESWIDSSGKVNPTKDRHVYSFSEDMLEPFTEGS